MLNKGILPCISYWQAFFDSLFKWKLFFQVPIQCAKWQVWDSVAQTSRKVVGKQTRVIFKSEDLINMFAKQEIGTIYKETSKLPNTMLSVTVTSPPD